MNEFIHPPKQEIESAIEMSDSDSFEEPPELDSSFEHPLDEMASPLKGIENH